MPTRESKSSRDSRTIATQTELPLLLNPASEEEADARSLSRDPTVAMATLREDALKAGATVFGEGSLTARLMLVGEAPGRVEVEAGRPFVGPAGKILTGILDRLAIPRRELWITNVVKVRPTVEGVQTQVNRPPTVSEVAAFRSFVDDEIRIIRPRVLVCLGAVAANALIHPNFRITAERGNWYSGPEGTRAMATFHPSYLLRLRGPEYETARDHVLADLSLAWSEAASASR